MPEDPLLNVAGPTATPQVRAAVRQQLGLDKALPDKFSSYVVGLLHGGLGTTFIARQSVRAAIAE